MLCGEQREPVDHANTRAGHEVRARREGLVPNAELLFSAGDQAERATDESQYASFLSPALLREIPFVASNGNHDVGPRRMSSTSTRRTRTAQPVPTRVPARVATTGSSTTTCCLWTSTQTAATSPHTLNG
jgi:hypothetical protein